MKKNTIILLIILTVLASLNNFSMSNAEVEKSATPYALAAGNRHSVVLKSDGTVWAWGDNISGQLGDGTNINKPKHIQVKDLADIVAIAAGRRHTIALKKDGTVWAWGSNNAAQLGNGLCEDSYKPVKVKGIDNIKYIYAFNNQNWAVRNDGTLWSWGLLTPIEIPSIPYVKKPKPTPITDEKLLVPQKITKVTDVKTVCSEGNYTMVLKEDGTVWTWGSNKYGQLGDGTTVDKEEPSQIKELTDVKAIAAKGDRCIALKKDGTVWVWGRDLSSFATYYENTLQFCDYDRLNEKLIVDGIDISAPELLVNILVPTVVTDLKDIVSVSAGLGHFTAIKSDGTVWAWGNNDYWQLGDEFKGTRYNKSIKHEIKSFGYVPTTEDIKAVHDVRKTPAQIKGVSDIVSIDSGNDYNLAVKKDGTVWAWGDNTSFKLGYRTSELVGQVMDLKLFDQLPTENTTDTPSNTPLPTPETKKEIVLQIDNKMMTVNGVGKEIDPGIGTAPIIENGSTLLPIRALIEAMGGTVNWTVKENKEMDIIIKANSKDILLIIGKNVTYINGEEKIIGIVPKIIKGRTMIPLRYVIENLGYKVNWDQNEKKITISF